jgi:hypothetical protein
MTVLVRFPGIRTRPVAPWVPAPPSPVQTVVPFSAMLAISAQARFAVYWKTGAQAISEVDVFRMRKRTASTRPPVLETDTYDSRLTSALDAAYPARVNVERSRFLSALNSEAVPQLSVRIAGWTVMPNMDGLPVRNPAARGVVGIEDGPAVRRTARRSSIAGVRDSTRGREFGSTCRAIHIALRKRLRRDGLAVEASRSSQPRWTLGPGLTMRSRRSCRTRRTCWSRLARLAPRSLRSRWTARALRSGGSDRSEQRPLRRGRGDATVVGHRDEGRALVLNGIVRGVRRPEFPGATPGDPGTTFALRAHLARRALGTGKPLRPGDALRTGEALWTGNALQPGRAGRTLRTSIAWNALRPGDALRTGDALWTGNALRPHRAGFTLRTSFAWNALLPGRPGRTRQTLRSHLAGRALWSGRSLWTELAPWAGGADRGEQRPPGPGRRSGGVVGGRDVRGARVLDAVVDGVLRRGIPRASPRDAGTTFALRAQLARRTLGTGYALRPSDTLRTGNAL